MDKQEYIKKINSASPFNIHNGITVTDLTDDTCTIECKLTPEAFNPWGTVHGGFIYSVCDVASGVVARSENTASSTISGNLYFLHPTRGEKIRAVGKLVKRGRMVNYVEVSVFDENDSLTARGTFEIFISPIRKK